MSTENDRIAAGESSGDTVGQKSGLSRRTMMAGVAWTVPAVMLSTAAPAHAASLSCHAGTHEAVGRGKLVSGTVFSVNLDTLASVNGVRAKSPAPQGTETGYTSDGTTGDYDEFANTLSITALQAIQIDATGLTNGTLTPILSNLLPANVGAHNQYSYAASEGLSKGAAGVVVDNGDTALTPDAAYPDFGTLELKTLLTPLLGEGAIALANVANLRLQIGAIAGRARWDVCAVPAQLTRDYLINHLRLAITSPLVANLANVIQTAVVAIDLPLAAASLTVSPGILTNGSDGATPPAPANPPEPLPDGASHPIQANLGAADTTTANGIPGGTILIDLSTLMGSAANNPFGQSAQPFLNGLPANSILFVDNGLTVPGSAVTNFTAALIAGLQERLLDAVSLSISVLGVGVINGTLRQLLANPLTALVAGTVQTLINALFASGGVLGQAVAAVGSLLNVVFGWLTGTINITLNVQNVPAANTTPPTPAAHPGPGAWDFAPRYDVAALAVNALAAIPSGLLALYLARGSVGPNT